jgi:hypothetical protein
VISKQDEEVCKGLLVARLELVVAVSTLQRTSSRVVVHAFSSRV